MKRLIVYIVSWFIFCGLIFLTSILLLIILPHARHLEVDNPEGPGTYNLAVVCGFPILICLLLPVLSALTVLIRESVLKGVTGDKKKKSNPV